MPPCKEAADRSGTVKKMAAHVIGVALTLCQLAAATSDLRKAATEPEVRSLGQLALATEIPEIYSDANPYNKAPRDGVDPKFDCAWRRAAYTYGKKLQPGMTTKQLAQLSDALQLGGCPGGAPLESGSKTEQERRTFPIADGSTPIYVDPSNPDSLHTALDKARTIPGHVTLALLPGVHRLTKPLLLSPADSNTTIQSHMGGEATLTGAKVLPGLKWEKYKVESGGTAWKVESGMNAIYGATNATPGVSVHGTTDSSSTCEAACASDAHCNVWTWHEPSVQGYAKQCWFRTDGQCCGTPEAGHISGFKSSNATNIWKATVPTSAGVSKITGLRLSGGRGQRARYPNANSETDQFPKGWVGGNGADGLQWAPVMHGPAPDQNIEVVHPNRSFCMTEFEFYEEGKGGCCAGFTPSEGYWCSSKTSGGGAFTYRIPSGITIGSRNHKAILPNSPYKNAKGAVFSAWRPGHWASWMFEVDHHVALSNGSTQLGWHIGGFQGARGSDKGAEWFIENVMEELDAGLCSRAEFD